jgi:hypothetical protein
MGCAEEKLKFRGWSGKTKLIPRKRRLSRAVTLARDASRPEGNPVPLPEGDLMFALREQAKLIVRRPS